MDQNRKTKHAVSNDDEPDIVTEMLGSKPTTKKLELTDFGEWIAMRTGHLLVVND